MSYGATLRTLRSGTALTISDAEATQQATPFFPVSLLVAPVDAMSDRFTIFFIGQRSPNMKARAYRPVMRISKARAYREGGGGGEQYTIINGT